MSYKNEIEANRVGMQRRKKQVFTAIQATALLLALLLITMTVMVIVDALSDGGDNSSDKDSSASLIQPVDGKTVMVYVGANVSYKGYVTYPEGKGYTLEIDNSKVDLSTPGRYTVVYTLKKNDKVADTFKLTLIVAERDVELEELMTKIEAKANTLGITKEMSKEEIVKKVYAFVNTGIPYTSTSASHTGNDRSKWETNWVKEALMTLETMDGDCYSNYSLSKAFFEYFGIENVGILRDENDGGLDGTHFWSVVNIGTKEKPKWYYYDSTKLAGVFSDGTKNACLITLDKLWSYHSSKIAEGEASSTFYAFDPSKYPTVSTSPIN